MRMARKPTSVGAATTGLVKNILSFINILSNLIFTIIQSIMYDPLCYIEKTDTQGSQYNNENSYYLRTHDGMSTYYLSDNVIIVRTHTHTHDII